MQRTSKNRWLANELHDELGAQLVSLKWSLEAFETKSTPANLEKANQNLDRLISEVQNFIASLRPEELTTFGLSISIERMVNAWQEKNTACKYTLINKTNESEISGAIAHALYRIVQESLTNIAKYSSATRVNIFLRILSSPSQKIAELTIEDNGVGFQLQRFL